MTTSSSGWDHGKYAKIRHSSCWDTAYAEHNHIEHRKRKNWSGKDIIIFYHGCYSYGELTYIPDICTKWMNMFLPMVESFTTISEISKSFRGKGIFLLAVIVFKSPGSSVVRATYRTHKVLDKLYFPEKKSC